MKRTISQKIKKSVSAILAAAMSLSLFTTIPVSADIGRTTYNYDGYSVDYNITNEWDGAQTVELTVLNTGTDSILNWALKYDAEGEISNLWNADLYEQNGDEYVIRNVGWNFEIAPNQSVTYGYTLNGSNISMHKSFEIYSKRVDKTEGYDVQYNITNSWDVGVEGNIVITNTSAAPIEAWTLSFDSNFTIDNFWNGRVLENNGTSYTVAAEIWTNPVQPNGSMTIGFVGSKAADVEALLSNFRLTEVVIGEGMPVIPIDPPAEEIEITANVVYDEENDNITVSWNTNNPNGIFDILMSSDGENFLSVGTVEGVFEFVYAPKNDFETLYFKVVQTVGEQVAESNVVAVAKSDDDIAISAEADYDEETGKITVTWTSNKENGIFEVFVSEDGENFIFIDIVEDISEFVYIPDSDFEILFFKVKQTIELKSAESNIALAIYPIDWEDETDTDNDGLTDVYENHYFGTDSENQDTDGDGLPDGYEVYYLGTNPVMNDSDGNETSDADEDFDSDGLTNLQEYELNTNPYNSDSDSDGFTDFDEINKYNTNPLKYDTDDDGVSDGDEIILGLNPINSATNGYPDSEYFTEQTIAATSQVFEYINNIEDNPYEVSVNINAAGVAENNLSVCNSGYSYQILQNEAVIGVVPEFAYNDRLSFNNIELSFNIDNSLVSNTNGNYISVSEEFNGIKRLNVFKFFDDTNILLPIETFHDVENNRVYAYTDELGTYCLIDMEIWFKNLGIEPEAAQLQSAFKVSKGRNLDVIFAIYSNSTLLKYTKSELIDAAAAIFEETEKQNVTARLHFVTWTGGIYPNNNTGTYYAENIDDAVLMINSTPVIDASLEPTTYMLTKAVNGIKNNMTEDFLENSDKYCFVIDGGCNPACSKINGGIDILKDCGMDFSFVYAPGCTNINNYAALSSNNSIYQMVFDNGRLAFWEYIYDYLFGKTEKIYQIISSVGLVGLPNDFGEINYNSKQDYDQDSLIDVDEIYFDVIGADGNKLVTVNPNGIVKLPSFMECVAAGGTYVESGLQRIYQSGDVAILDHLYEIKVLPIKSDPTNKDSDGDGLLDGSVSKSDDNIRIIAPQDPNPLKIDGPNGIWSSHIASAKGNVPTSLGGYYEYDKNSKSIREISLDGLNILDSSSLYNFLKKYTTGSWEEYSTGMGSKALMFKLDNDGVALHSQTMADRYDYIVNYIKTKFKDEIPDYITKNVLDNPKLKKAITQSSIQIDIWQRPFGYNDLYDWGFGYGTNANMDVEKFFFSETTNGILGEKDNEYILWIWRGDYLNCGPGSEMGIYKKFIDENIFGKNIQHWKTVNFNVPMSLSLYDYNFPKEIDCIYNWFPENPQWWITGFNPNKAYNDVNKQILIGSIDFSEHTEMFNSLKEYTTLERPDLSKYAYYDERNHIVWICWFSDLLKN